MVQVDVFWAYGIGASLAMASGLQLRRVSKPMETKYFIATLLVLALIWAPTGMLLLLRNTSWETMQVAENMAAMPHWLVLGFGITNITQGILGFWVGAHLVRSGKLYLAHLNWMVGYFGMFFILVYGWDGLGFDRFFYDRDMHGAAAWSPGKGATMATLWSSIGQFLTSSVAMTLYVDGVFLVPALVMTMMPWMHEGMQQIGMPAAKRPSSARMTYGYLFGVFALCLGSAIFCAVVVNYVGQMMGVGPHVARALGQIPANTTSHVLSYLVGLPLSLGLLLATVLSPKGLLMAHMARQMPSVFGDLPPVHGQKGINNDMHLAR